MQESRKKKKKAGLKPVYKPYHKGSWHTKAAVRQGLKLMLYYLAFAFIYVILGTPLQFDNAFLCTVCNLILVLVCGAIVYMNAAKTGENEVALGEIVLGREEAGKKVNPKDLENCYHPMKGWFVLLVAAIPILLVTVPFALTAKKQVYALQSLPSWVSSYEGQEEIFAPLSYYQLRGSLSFLDYLQLISRILIFPFTRIASLISVEAILTFDRISPLLALVPALGYPLGYLTGPRSRALTHGSIAGSNKRRARRQKKDIEERRRQREEAARKKNELV